MTRRHLTHYLTDTRQMIQQLHAEYTDLERRLTAWAKDGYPSTSGQPGTSGRGSISDPTAQAVLAPDQVRLDREQLHASLIRLHDIAITLDNIRRTYMTTDTDKRIEQLRKLEACANQLGCPDQAYAVKAGRCSACYQHHRRTGEER